MRVRLVIGLLAIVGMASACGEHKSVLDEGVGMGMSDKTQVISRAEALADGRRRLAYWKSEIRKKAKADPKTRFQNPDTDLFLQRVSDAASRYEFDVVSVELLRPRQLAPKVIVSTTHYLDLARKTPAILRRLDPKAATSDDRTGWRYEAFYFEARDEHGVPFLTVFNSMRGPRAGGGQWARSERLYPFQHG
jgi:hypothetical protein